MSRSVSEILAARRPPERKLRLVLDGGLAARVADLEARVRQARLEDALTGGGLSDRAPAIERELTEARAMLDESAAEFTFQAIGRVRLAEITSRFPPTQAQWDRHRQEAAINPFTSAPPDYDYESLAPEVIAASCVDPAMTVEEARRLWDELSDGQAAALFEAAWAVNNEVSNRPTSGTDTDTTPSFGPESTTPPNGGSPSASSRAGS